MAGVFGFFNSVSKVIFGDNNARYLKTIQPLVARINALEGQYSLLSDTGLLGTTTTLKTRLNAGENLDAVLPDAFAAVREAARRALGLRAFDVQLQGGITLHQGRIAEMKTGEGKTLVATFPTYLNALAGKGVHVVTVNDYLALRDSQWMGQVFARLGLTTSAITNVLDATQRKAAYAADITYATNNELHPSQLVQRPLHYAVIDEVDSILIDEARTPLIISGPADDKTELYQTIDALAPQLLENTHYEIDAKQKSVHLTDAGIDAAEAFLKAQGLLPEGGNLYDVHHIALVHHVGQALRAHTLFKRDVEYIVKNNDQNEPEVVLIDEFTGRMMAGRRLSEGLHQAIEAKEQVLIKPENITLASITFQNYFRLYPKLAGMTGTAATEAEEFESIYNLPVTVMPTNVGVARVDEADTIYRSVAGKTRALIADIADCHQRGQPVLVGTASIERSEELAGLLKAAGVPHQVLNARFHETEAAIIAQAGRKGAVTIATNMAGRGTDIKLGGNLELLLKNAETEAETAAIKAAWQAEHAAVMAAGGLRVIGTERHESRRIDNQLRGRSGRQGDVGSSVFYLSLQDDLLKRFAPNLDSLMTKLNMPEDEAIQHKWISKSIETAQRKIEALHFDMRKHVLKFDDVLNEQRKVIYDQRTQILHTENLTETIHEFRTESLDNLLAEAFPAGSLPEQWQPDVVTQGLAQYFNIDLNVAALLHENEADSEAVIQKVREVAAQAWDAKLAEVPPEIMANIQKMVLLQNLDRVWRQHLQALEYLRKGINLRGFAQKDPINEFARESFMLFEDVLRDIKRDTTALLARVRLVLDPEEQPPAPVAAPAAPVKAAAKPKAAKAPAKKPLKKAKK
jgi:preprotein translocase subunit SecA